MGILSRIFGNKEVVEEVVEEKTQEEEREDVVEENDYPICSQCEMAIHPDQRVKTFNGKKMHMKPCWFKLRKIAKGYV